MCVGFLTGGCPHLYVGIAWLTVSTTKLLERAGEKEKRIMGGNKNMFQQLKVALRAFGPQDPGGPNKKGKWQKVNIKIFCSKPFRASLYMKFWNKDICWHKDICLSIVWLPKSICLTAARGARNNNTFRDTVLDRWLGMTTPKIFLIWIYYNLLNFR